MIGAPARIGWLFALAMTIALVLPISGVLSAPTPATDVDLSNSIRERLLHYGGVGAGQVNIAVKAQIATLSGTVSTLLTRRRAASLAQAVPGIRGVINLLAVNPDVRLDSDIATDVRANLATHPALREANVEVYCIEGTVTLGGVVLSQAERYLADLSASGTPSVREVYNDIEISPTPDKSDARIVADIEEMLQWDAWLADKSISARVSQGRAILTGKVESPFERARATELASLAGPTVVENEILVSGGDSPLAAQDKSIASTIPDVMAQDPRLQGFIPRIAISKGTAVLSGTAPSFAAAAAALEDTRTVPGVSTVENRMTVNPKDQPTDASLQREIRAAFARNPHVPVDDVTISVSQGRVLLRGILSDEAQRRAIMRILAQTPGVHGVTDKLTVIIFQG
jgi:osmotically-inducible protein OsmY